MYNIQGDASKRTQNIANYRSCLLLIGYKPKTQHCDNTACIFSKRNPWSSVAERVYYVRSIAFHDTRLYVNYIQV